MADGFFAIRPLKNCISARRHKKLVRIANLFKDRSAMKRSAFYRRYMAPQTCAHGVCLLFWQRARLMCAIVIMRSADQGDFSVVETKLLRQLYRQFSIALDQLRSLEQERAVRLGLEEFVRRLPLPTILLRWNLRLLFQNPAAREFCSIWQKGWEQARATNVGPSVPPDILDECRRLKSRIQRAGRRLNLKRVQVYAAHSPQLRATIAVKQLTSAVAQPHFMIECEDLRPSGNRPDAPINSKLSSIAQLTPREQEITRFVCDGQSNQEIASAACLSLPTVKKHLHTIFGKLEVTSRSQLMARLL